MFGDDEGDVVVLLVGAEALDFVNNGNQGSLRRGFAMALEGFDQALFAELVVGGGVGFGDAVGGQSEGVPWMELGFCDGAIPILEIAWHGGGSVEALHNAIAAE